jgi:release factor glutamine methyltransferase
MLPLEHDRLVGSADEKDWAGFVPTLDPEQVRWITEWHERAYRDGRAEGARDQGFDYLGATIVVPPNVMPITPMSHLLGEAVLAEAKSGHRVLDMGTGSGVNAVLAAMRGAEVVAADINADALAAATANAQRNGVADRIDVRRSDVFSAVTETFDVIVFDPPFRWFRPRDRFELASTDHGYRAMTRFFQEARSHLRDGGRMLIFFGTSGDLGYLVRLIEAEQFDAVVIAHDDLTRDGVTVDYFTYRLT